jgi:hypothetical protein
MLPPMLPRHLKLKNLSQIYHENNWRIHLHPWKRHNDTRPIQLPKVVLDQSHPVAGAVARGMQLYHHVGWCVSHGRTRHYLMLRTRHAPYAHPTSIAVQLVPTPTAKRHGIRLMTEIPYVLP